MFHKIKNVMPLPDYRLSVRFSEGVLKFTMLNLYLIEYRRLLN